MKSIGEDAYFDNIAAWGRMGERLKAEQSLFLKYIGRRMPVLDIGCGYGTFLELLQERGIIYEGIDIDNAMVERCRAKGLEKPEYISGLITIGFIIPLSFVTVFNIIMKRQWWTIVLPVIVICFLIVELVLDYILKLDFRNTH